GEDGADRDVDVDVRGAVERVHQDDVAAGAVVGLDGDGLGVLLGADEAALAAAAEGADELFVREDVELLLGVAGGVLPAGLAEDLPAAGPSYAAVCDHRGEGDVREEPGGLPRRARHDSLPLDDELFVRLELAAAGHEGLL